uniref:hypothetical protein n=1 Tax=Pedobacter schmidteae TaxID=2201271 RepID=UPI000EAD3C67|nr:hypothetical protein [Pedobacter schmidteae]
MEMQPLSIASEHSKSFKRLIRLLTWKFKPQQLFCFAQNPSPANMLRKAEKKYLHYIQLIDGFLAGATHCIKNQQYSICIMMLYHTVKHCTELLISLHLSCPMQLRSLYVLIDLCCSFSNEPQRLWLLNESDKKLFDLLIRTYSEAGFGITYPVSEDDLSKLFIKTTTFAHFTKEMCKQKITILDQQAETSRTLKKESGVYYD